MYQVKVFDEEHEDDLTESINCFLKEMPHIQIWDIKFAIGVSAISETEQLYCFSAMIIYQNKEIG